MSLASVEEFVKQRQEELNTLNITLEDILQKAINKFTNKIDIHTCQHCKRFCLDMTISYNFYKDIPKNIFLWKGSPCEDCVIKYDARSCVRKAEAHLSSYVNGKRVYYHKWDSNDNIDDFDDFIRCNGEALMAVILEKQKLII